MTWWMNPSCSSECTEGPYLGQITWPCPPADCGWTLPAYPPERPRPVFHYPIPPSPAQIPHPQFPQAQPLQFGGPVAVGHDDHHQAGACCGSCAKGGACESSCEDKKKAVGALYVSDAELDALGTQVALMSGDVQVATGAEKAATPGGGPVASAAQHAVWALCRDQQGTWDSKTLTCDFAKPDPTGASIGTAPETPPRPLTKYEDERWTPFALKWNSYRAQTIHEPTSFDVLRTEFSSLRDEWVGPLAQKTRSTVPPPLSDSSGANAIPWVWIGVAGAIVLLPFILPSIAALYLVATRGRTLGLG